MAQLRDARTSALIAEGTPLELALVAETLGRRAVVVGPGEEVPADADLLFDDVGVRFDPELVLERARENADGLAAAAAPADADDDLKAAAQAAADELEPTEELLEQVRDGLS